MKDYCSIDRCPEDGRWLVMSAIEKRPVCSEHIAEAIVRLGGDRGLLPYVTVVDLLG